MTKNEAGEWVWPEPWANPDAPRPRLAMSAPPCKDQVFYKDWSRRHNARCMACHITAGKAEFHRWPGLQTHHIVKPGRSHESANLIRLCQRCHELAEGKEWTGYVNDRRLRWPRLEIENVVWLKMLDDGAAVDLMRLSELLGRYVQKPEPFRHPVFAERRDRAMFREPAVAWDWTEPLAVNGRTIFRNAPAFYDAESLSMALPFFTE